MRTVRGAAGVLGLLLACAAAAPADETPPPPAAAPEPEGTLPPVEIRAPRIHASPLGTEEVEVAVAALRREAEAFDTPRAVSILPEGDLRERRAARSIPDALLRLPSVLVQKTGPGQSSPYIRGFTGYQTLFLVDGIRLNNSAFRDGPNQYWSTVDVWSIERLEVVRGPHSVLYGSDAVGGTVNASPRRRHTFAPGSHAEGGTILRAASGERATFERVEAEGNSGGVGWSAGVTAKQYGDLRSGGGYLPYTGFGEWDGDARVDVQRGSSWLWTLGFQHVRQDDAPRTHTTVHARPFHGSAVGSELLRDLDQQRDLLYGRATFTGSGPLRRASLTLSWQRQWEEQDRLRTGGRRDLQGFEVETLGVQWQAEQCSPIGLLTWGVDWYHDELDSWRDDYLNGVHVLREVQGPLGDDGRYDLLGAYVEDHLRWGALEVFAGLRFTYASAEAGRVDNPLVAGSDPATPGNVISVEDDWTSLVASLRALWHVSRGWILYGGVSQAFRAPTLYDLTAFDATSVVETPSPGLDPDEYLSFELGAKTEQRCVSASGAVWCTLLDDTIVRSPTGNLIGTTPEVRKDNVGDGWVAGVELDAAVRLAPAWTAFGVLTWMDGEVDQYTDALEKVRAPQTRLMPPTGVLGLRFEPPAGRAWAQAEIVAADDQDRLSERDKTDTQRIPPGGTPGYAVLNLRAGLALSERVRLSVAVENLFDRDFRIHGSGVNEPGLNLVAVLEARW